jgi:hypothetical protein
MRRQANWRARRASGSGIGKFSRATLVTGGGGGGKCLGPDAGAGRRGPSYGSLGGDGGGGGGDGGRGGTWPPLWSGGNGGVGGGVDGNCAGRDALILIRGSTPSRADILRESVASTSPLVFPRAPRQEPIEQSRMRRFPGLARDATLQGANFLGRSEAYAVDP